MNSALIEIGDPDINEERVIQPLQFKFSKKFIKNIKKHLQNDKDNIANAILISDCYLDKYNVYLQNIINYLQRTKDYNFLEQEKVFNQFPHFYTTVDDLKIHYIHVKPINPDKKPVYPLLMLHGWPSSVLEFYDVIPKLVNATKLNDFIFEVIIPSLPGFGGSDCPSHENLNCEFIAGLLVKFMKVLGHEQFYVHCDDWCVFVVHAMSLKYSANLLAIHYALCQVENFTDLLIYTSTRIMEVRKAHEEQLILNNDYYNSPTSLCTLTLGISLQYSPVILMTYLLEKFVKDSVHNDTLNILNDYKYLKFLNNVMMYWATDSITNTLKAYSGYFTFNKYVDENDFIESRNNTFVGITLFLPEHVRPNIELKDYCIFCIYKENSFRFPAIEDPHSLTNNIFQTFKLFLAQNGTD